MPIFDDEWVAVGKGSYNGQTVARVHLEDARKGNVPAPGTPYTIFVRLDKDHPRINGRCQLDYDTSKLDYDTFMQNDRVLMITGSPESREALAKMLFGKQKDGGEGWSNIRSYHSINEVSFDAKAKGRLAYLGHYDGGLDGSSGNFGRFVGVGAGDVVQPTLEQTLAVVKYRS